MWHGVDQGEQEGMGMLSQSLEARDILPKEGPVCITVDLELTEHHLRGDVSP